MGGAAAPAQAAWINGTSNLQTPHIARPASQASIQSVSAIFGNSPAQAYPFKRHYVENSFSRKNEMPNRHSHTLRRGRYSEAGRLYLLTTVTHQRISLFHDFQHARLVIDQLRRCEREQLCRSLAWVVMPDHVHWLIELKKEPLGGLMRRLKARSSMALHKAGLPSQRVWQAGYHDRALRREDDVVRVARYIVANPVRAGLVKSTREYPHWDAVWL